jgi:hypothetical protein
VPGQAEGRVPARDLRHPSRPAPGATARRADGRSSPTAERSKAEVPDWRQSAPSWNPWVSTRPRFRRSWPIAAGRQLAKERKRPRALRKGDVGDGVLEPRRKALREIREASRSTPPRPRRCRRARSRAPGWRGCRVALAEGAVELVQGRLAERPLGGDVEFQLAGRLPGDARARAQLGPGAGRVGVLEEEGAGRDRDSACGRRCPPSGRARTRRRVHGPSRGAGCARRRARRRSGAPREALVGVGPVRRRSSPRGSRPGRRERRPRRSWTRPSARPTWTIRRGRGPSPAPRTGRWPASRPCGRRSRS